MSNSDDRPTKRLKQANIGSYFKSKTSHQEDMNPIGKTEITKEKVETTKASNFHSKIQNNSSSDDDHEIRGKNTSGIYKTVEHKTLGEPICDMNREPECTLDLEDLVATSTHTVLIDANFPSSGCPHPTPKVYVDKWHQDFVRLPCSQENLYPVSENGTKKLTSRWNLIVESLSSEIKSAFDLTQCILKYNTRFEMKWDFCALSTFINKILSNEERERFFEVILPGIVKLALDLPQVCTQAIPLLKCNQEHSVTMSQKQVACLLANAFFCTFPRRNTNHKHSEYFTYPDINFIQLFSSQDKKTGTEFVKFEKLKCLLNYFHRVSSEEPTGVITFQRKCLQEFPVWDDCKSGLSDVHLTSDGLIEKQRGMLQVDFANKFLGGGALGRGCVQEEILFVICPELIASRLFIEAMKKNEAVVIIGCECYNETSGYSRTFKWESNFIDTLPRDKWNRKCRKTVAIDAVRFPFKNSPLQYNKESVDRELNKAFVGFCDSQLPSKNLSTIATGNWGCGAFNGSAHLKFLIQLMAASHAGRSIAYFTFGDPSLCKQLYEMYLFLKLKELTVGDVIKLLRDYHSSIVSSIKPGAKKFRPSISLSAYIKKVCSIESDSDDATEIDSPIMTVDDTPLNAEPSSSNLKACDSKITLDNNSNNMGDNPGFGSEDMFDDSDDDAWMHKFYGVS